MIRISTTTKHRGPLPTTSVGQPDLKPSSWDLLRNKQSAVVTTVGFARNYEDYGTVFSLSTGLDPFVAFVGATADQADRPHSWTRNHRTSDGAVAVTPVASQIFPHTAWLASCLFASKRLL